MITVRAAAKVNLHLGVGAPREDGFHPLDTVFQGVSLYDDLSAAGSGDWSLRLTGAGYVDLAQVPTDDRNIVHRVAVLLGREDAAISIHKEIPAAGGMAGGSADAAAALVALDRIWDLDTPDDRLLELAAELGSDVPFALVGGTARGRGRGEIIDPVEDLGPWWWAVVPADVGLSTPEVYRHFDRLFPDADRTPPPADPVLKAIATGDPVELARELRNDLQAPAIDLRPELGRLIERGEAEGALRGLVSGSGPTVVFLCRTGDEARVVAAALAGVAAVGPVAGAHVI